MSLMRIDIGTTGTKAIVFNHDGDFLTSGYKEYNLLFPQTGWVEFDTEYQRKKIFEVLKNVNNNPQVIKDPVTALAVSIFGEGLTPIDAKGNVIHNTIYSIDKDNQPNYFIKENVAWGFLGWRKNFLNFQKKLMQYALALYRKEIKLQGKLF